MLLLLAVSAVHLRLSQEPNVVDPSNCPGPEHAKFWLAVAMSSCNSLRLVFFVLVVSALVQHCLPGKIITWELHTESLPMSGYCTNVLYQWSCMTCN